MAIQYRSDIDGLRALAVLAVICFHAGLGSIHGGYIGVDIFFVISGYLIGGIIYKDLSSGNFSLTRFYKKRFRRIIPALFVVVMVTLLVGYFLLPPNLLEKLGKSAIYTAFFSSNIFFYKESGYFDVASELKPLLHTWSLGVEEQYYIFFPLFLMFLFKKSIRLSQAIVGIFLLSFISSMIITPLNQVYAFYMLPTRIWEFFLGVISAVNIIPYFRKKPLNDLLALSGLMMIIYSIFFFDKSTVFPGISALLPSLGAVMIIHSSRPGNYTAVSRFFSLRPLVFVGLISYSLYLWHWPLLVYGKLYYLQKIPGTALTILLIATFFLAWLSWRYIEVPFRREVTPIQRRWGTFRVSFVMLGMILAFGLFYKTTNGLDNRFQMDIALADQEHWKKCEDHYRDTGVPCRLGDSHASPQFLLWGDSHARALAEGIDQAAKDLNQSGVITSLSSCPPLLGVDHTKRRFCEEFNLKVLRYLQEHPELDTVILAARWPLSWHGTRSLHENGQPVKLVDLKNPNRQTENQQLFREGLLRTLDRLQKMGRSVLLVLPIPEISLNVTSIQPVVALRRLTPAEYAPKRSLYTRRSGPIRKWFSSLPSRYPNLKIVDPLPRLTEGERLKLFLHGITLYRDSNHLSTYGSRYLSPIFVKTLRKTSQ